MKAPKEKMPLLQKESPEKQEACACCSLFYSDYAVQELERNWDDARGLESLMKELLEEGFGHFAKPVLWRWKKLKKKSQDPYPWQVRIDEQIWVAGQSPRIHDFDKPTMSDAEMERGIAHDLAILERQWAKNKEPIKREKTGTTIPR